VRGEGIGGKGREVLGEEEMDMTEVGRVGSRVSAAEELQSVATPSRLIFIPSPLWAGDQLVIRP